MDEFRQADRRVGDARDGLTSQMVLAAASAVAALAVPQARSLFVTIAVFAFGAAIYYVVTMWMAIDTRRRIGDRLALENVRGLAGHAEWLGRARTQHHVAVELRRMRRSVQQEANLHPSPARRMVDDRLGLRLARLADRLDRDAGRLPAATVARIRLFIAQTYPLVVFPPDDADARRHAVEAALQALDRIEAALDADMTPRRSERPTTRQAAR